MFDDEELVCLADAHKEPLVKQRLVAARLDKVLSVRMNNDVRGIGSLSKVTLKILDIYLRLLDSIQKNTYGDRSVNLHLHSVSHSIVVFSIL